ncbi:ANGL7-like protein [Mya arenaria]|uniref:ANGL7-like protein n=1 Tax=Mya arenaria TaxID=6604 RepID=A0ABY7DGX3_MYAAR|nr:microfibril-associated glycoprotein 4-like isoform X1 [Mya arenaria]WAQ95957.1 ANGL7-like protein [Mya arenaria]
MLRFATESLILNSSCILVIVIWMLCRDVGNGAGDTFICNGAQSTFKNAESDTRLAAMEGRIEQLQKLVDRKESGLTTIQGFPRDCGEIYANGSREDGLYHISPDGRCPFLVYCDMEHGGWTFIQKRLDGSVNFYQPWAEYVRGFGDVSSEHWLGLEKIHRLTQEGVEIFFNMSTWEGGYEFAHYKVFTVHEAATAYKMNVDAFGYEGSIKELLSYHDNMKFSTFDRDNDLSVNNCCQKYMDGGGWWYNTCYRLGCVNGVFGKKELGGIGYWDAKHVPIKSVNIKIRQMEGTC